MSGASYLFYFIPITFVVLLVLEACRSDSPAKILRRTLSAFGTLSLVLAVGGAVIYVVNRYF
jgi:hypothetical protein